MHGRVRQQADALDSEVGEDLAAEADGAEDAAACGPASPHGAQFLVEDEALAVALPKHRQKGLCRSDVEGRGNGRSLVDFKAARGVVKVEDRAAAFFGNHAHGIVENFAAAAIGCEDVAGCAARVHANQNGVGARRAGLPDPPGTLAGPSWHAGQLGAQVATDEGDVAFAAVDLALVGDHAELAVLGLNGGFAGTDDVALVAKAVADQFRDGEDSQAVLAQNGSGRECGPFRHRRA